MINQLALINIYVYSVVKQLKDKVNPRITLKSSRQCIINTLLFSDDQIIILKTENDLQLAGFQACQLHKEYIRILEY